MSADDHLPVDPARDHPPGRRPMHREEHLGATQAVRAPRPERPVGEDTQRVVSPGAVHVYAESILTKVARGFAIARDATIMVLIVFAVLTAHSFLAGLRNAVRPDPAAPTVSQTYPCPSPTTDQFGTFCPITPGY